ncbi:MAG: hypothetical protein ACREFQ_04020, partial [Stellaceae bacterium]
MKIDPAIRGLAAHYAQLGWTVEPTRDHLKWTAPGAPIVVTSGRHRLSRFALKQIEHDLERAERRRSLRSADMRRSVRDERARILDAQRTLITYAYQHSPPQSWSRRHGVSPVRDASPTPKTLDDCGFDDLVHLRDIVGDMLDEIDDKLDQQGTVDRRKRRDVDLDEDGVPHASEAEMANMPGDAKRTHARDSYVEKMDRDMKRVRDGIGEQDMSAIQVHAASPQLHFNMLK